MPADPASPELIALLRLTLMPDLGPARIGRLLEKFGSAQAALSALPESLRSIKGFGPALVDGFAASARASEALAQQELARLAALNARAIARGTPEFPALLAAAPDAPPLLFVRGSWEPTGADQYAVALVGSRHCTAYGIEQAERFGGALARAGITVVSGGARGIDTAAHRGAMAAGGRTIVVQGCGLAHDYPPENADLYRRLLESSRAAIVSELPVETAPHAKNFPARNRIISGLSLGVVVIEAGEKSGALITARLAADDHGREVCVVPGRVDSPASRGSLQLLKEGVGQLVTEPGDVIAMLESAARHQHGGTFGARYTPAKGDEAAEPEPGLFAPEAQPPKTPRAKPPSERSQPAKQPPAKPAIALSAEDERIVSALRGEGLGIEQLVERTGLATPTVLTRLTMLELAGRVRRSGATITLARA